MSYEVSKLTEAVHERFANIKMRRATKKLASHMLVAASGYEHIRTSAHPGQSEVEFFRDETWVAAEFRFLGETGCSTAASIGVDLPNYGRDRAQLTVRTGPNLRQPEELTTYHFPPKEGEFAALPTGDTKLALRALQTSLAELAKSHTPVITEEHYAPYAPHTSRIA